MNRQVLIIVLFIFAGVVGTQGILSLCGVANELFHAPVSGIFLVITIVAVISKYKVLLFASACVVLGSFWALLLPNSDFQAIAYSICFTGIFALFASSWANPNRFLDIKFLPIFLVLFSSALLTFFGIYIFSAELRIVLATLILLGAIYCSYHKHTNN